MRTKEEKELFRREMEERTVAFAADVFKLLDVLPKKNSTRVIAFQLGKSASSIGANYREANRAESRDDFAHKLQIALKEAAESCYWFEVLIRLYPEHSSSPDTRLQTLYRQCVEFRNILQSSGRTLHRQKVARQSSIS